MYTTFQKKACLIVTFIYLLASILIVNSTFSDLIFLPSNHRSIAIPIYFWGTAIAYLIVLNYIYGVRIKIKEFTKDCIIVGMPIHLYLLLGNLLSQLSKGSPLPSIYLFYIWVVAMLFSTFLAMSGVYGGKKEIGMALMGKDFSSLFLWTPIALSICLLFQANIKEFAIIFIGFIVGILIAKLSNLSSIRNIFARIYDNDRLLIFFIFVFAFLVRYAFAINIIAKTGYSESYGFGFISASDDGPTYDGLGKSLMNDFSMLFNGGVLLWGHWDKAYGVFIGIIYSIFGRNFYAVTFFQSILGALIPLFLFLIGKRALSKGDGIIAAIITSLNEPLIFLSVVFGHESLWLPILTAFTFFLVEISHGNDQEKIHWKALIAAGFLLGFLAIVRSLYLYFFAFVALWFIFFRKAKFIKRFAEAGIILIVAGVLIIGVFKITQNSFGRNVGKAGAVWGVERLYPPFENIGNSRLIALGINPFENMEKSIEAIILKPLVVLKTAFEIYPLRVIAYFETYQFGYFDPLYMVNPARIPSRFASNLEFYTTLMFLIGLTALITQRKVLSFPLFIPLLFHIFSYAIVFSHMAPRLREVSIPFVYMIGAVGINSFLKSVVFRDIHR